ncbi:MAG: secretin N-terminal domain-containing protein [candidate division Zixibacteria bacterium]|jgi:type IV pilus assembly protein PilQ|nr:secretin N-terminal domain-containing protein [candidate division Zixibacteria bacterium]
MFRKSRLLPGLFIFVLAASAVVSAQETQDPTQPIKNLQFQSADIRSVLTFLADYGGVNVVVAPDVEGTVTIQLRNVMWRDALTIIGRTYNLAVVDEEAGYLRVLPEEDYRKEVTEANKHNLEQRQLAELQTRIVKISNSTSDDIVRAVQSLMTDRGKATSDPRSNSIIIQEVPTNMENVLSYVEQLDKPAAQIKISAQLLEISSRGLEEFGVRWTAEGAYVTESGRSYTQKGEVLADRGTDPAARYSVTALNNDWSVDAVIEALVSSGKGKIIAHPEITTLDNKEARIQMGQKVPIKQFDESGNIITKFEEVGTILAVTPHITAENQILMHLKPERSTYEFDANGVIINTNNAETHVIVANGQTAVIGGLTTQDEVETSTGVPVLKDIPLLGALFRYSEKRTESRDLVIFVTPTIVEAELALEG